MTKRRIKKVWCGGVRNWRFVVQKRFLFFWITEETFVTYMMAKEYYDQADYLIVEEK